MILKSLLQTDIIMKSASIRGLAIIMELKVADDFAEMEAGCNQALNQIETRKYAMELEMEGYKDSNSSGRSAHSLRRP